ncbi:Hemin ABC transporter, permease protein [Minicystis rosea]|nr:Hemin ABC transporter, permease protein [Minicystis rosea]
MMRWRRSPSARTAVIALAVLLAISLLVSARMGAVELSTGQVLGILAERVGIRSPWAFDAQQASLLLSIRAPRLVLAALIGAALAASGAAMQGLFRNPLADPALLGVSSGASLGAVATIVLGARILGRFPGVSGLWVLSAAAFVTGLLATWTSAGVARVGGRTRTALMLLAGVAVNALAWAGIGLAMHVATDAQLRNITFWTLGSVGGATWHAVMVTGPLLLATVLILPRLARGLNALLLGEAEAMHLGVRVERVKVAVVVLTALSVGASVSVAGVVAFVGLVVPHVVRLLVGPDHRRLLPGAALLGATLLTLADVIARTVAAPAELPLGVVTAAIGAPFFLWQLTRDRAAAVMQ